VCGGVNDAWGSCVNGYLYREVDALVRSSGRVIARQQLLTSILATTPP